MSIVSVSSIPVTVLSHGRHLEWNRDLIGGEWSIELRPMLTHAVARCCTVGRISKVTEHSSDHQTAAELGHNYCTHFAIG